MKDTYIRIRLSERDKEIIKTDSEAMQMSMSEYLIHLIRREHDRISDALSYDVDADALINAYNNL